MRLANWYKLHRGGKPTAFICGLAFLTVMASGVAIGQENAGQDNGWARAEGRFAPATANVQGQAQRRLPKSLLPTEVVLDRVGAARLSTETAGKPSKPGIPLKIGFSRDVPTLRTTTQTSALMAWAVIPGGQLAAISVTAPDALGVRLGLFIEALPITATLRFYAQGATPVFEVSGQEITETIARNLAAGDKTDEARTYWSPTIDGQEITVEIELPSGVPPDEVKISIPRLSHLFSTPLNPKALTEKIGEAASCNLDSMCYQATWSNESSATARMVFTSGGSSYNCTGTLVSDQDTSTFVPYFLSANHCISSQSEASSLQTYWFYQSSSCNSGNLNPSSQTLTGGATLLYATATTDTSFMRLNKAPPAGVYATGWLSNLQPLNTPDTGIHNPHGDLQKISFGTITGYSTCSSGDSFSCSSASSGTANHLASVGSQGITESGSSGSGLWVASGGSHYLVGQLHGGSSSCASPNSTDYYGRFDVAYNAALYQWLASGATANYTLSVAKTGTGLGTVVSSPAGISCGATCSASYPNGATVTLTATPSAGSIFGGWSGACTGTSSCAVNVNQIQSVTASFSVGSYTLSVAKSGPGTGIVTSSPEGIICGATCTANYDGGTDVALTAAASAGSVFSGWSGACTGAGSCIASMTAAKSVTATFALPVRPMVAAGWGHTVALKSDGTVVAWGDGTLGRLGNGSSLGQKSPVSVTDLTGVVALAAGENHTVAVKSDGSVMAWGYNSNGQLGDGSTITRRIPVTVSGLTGVIAVAAGNSHTLALKADGTVVSWGWNAFGQLGDGTSTDRLSPAAVPGLNGIVAISAGAYYSVALKADGSLMAWGSNSGGELGDGAGTNLLRPVAFPGLTGVVSIATGYMYMVALKTDGTLLAWGYNSSGLLGGGTTWDSPRPVAVPGLNGIVAISAGDSHTLALKADGSLVAWGNNEWGQLGEGTTTTRLGAVIVPGLTDILSVSASGIQNVAMKADGTMVSWGHSKSSPQAVPGGVTLGDITLAISPSPTALTFAAQSIGSSSSAQSITLSNTGRLDFYSPFVFVSGDYSRTTTCGIILAPGDSCNVSVTFTPTAAGTRTGNLSLVVDETVVNVANLIGASTGIPTGSPSVAFSPTTLTFDAQSPSATSAAQAITLSNPGAATLNLTSIVANGDFAVANNCGAGLGAGGSCSLNVTFTPTATGTRTGWIAITSNATGSPHSVSLSGVGAALAQTIGAINLSPSSLAVGGTTTISAAATSGLAVSFSSKTTSICTVSGATVTGVAAGTCIIAADQAGNASYSAAPQILQTVSVTGLISQTISFANPGVKTMGAAPFEISAIGGASGNPVTFTSQTTGVCTVSGSTVTLLAVGTCTIAANQVGNASYLAAPQVTQSIAVSASSAAGPYDGIYQWSPGNYLSLHQDGTHMIATIYFNADGSFSFPATSGTGVLPVPQLDIFDLMNGQVAGSTVRMNGTRFHRACNATYDFTFNNDATITVARIGVSNTAVADAAGISCSAIVGAEPIALSVPKIRFNSDPAPVANVGLYDGIYQWSSGNYLSLHQDGTHMIATIYFNADGSFSFPATSGTGVLPVPQLDIFDLMNGQVAGSTVTMNGTRFHRACNVAYDFTFNGNDTITLSRSGVGNTAAADAAGIACSAIVGAEPITLSVPKIRFN